MPKFTAAQQAAIDAPIGPVRVFAGAGSGKTAVLTMRYAKLLREGADARRVLVCTFSKPAALALRDRVESMKISIPPYAWIGTIHSVFYRILREELGREIRVITETGYTDKKTSEWCDGRITLATRLLRDHNLTKAHALETRRILQLFDRWRMNMIRSEDVVAFVHAEVDEKSNEKIWSNFLEFYDAEGEEEDDERTWDVFCDIAELFRLFQIEKSDRQLVDFSDMVFMVWDMFDRNHRTREKWAGRFDHILVDEFQDVDSCQFVVLHALASKCKSFFAVGDPDQSIYAFRGAVPEIMLSFNRFFENPKTILLDQNFRCPSSVVEMANVGIGHNKVREPNRFFSTLPAVMPELLECTDFDEGERVAEYISQLLLAGAKHRDIVVIYRTNAQSVRFETALLHREIPFEMKNGRSFFDATAVADLVAYLELVCGAFSPDAVDRIKNKPTRYVSRKAIGAWRKENPTLEGLRDVPGLGYGESGALQRLYSDIRNVETVVRRERMTTRKALEEVMERIDYVEWARENLQEDPQDDDLAATIDALRLECDAHPDPRDFFQHVRSARSHAGKKTPEAAGGVLLSTFHGVKGLEWPHVILTGMSDRWMPHKRAKSARAIEEERRLAHVGLTRTMKTVLISMPGSPSRFVTEWKMSLRNASEPSSSSPDSSATTSTTGTAHSSSAVPSSTESSADTSR